MNIYIPSEAFEYVVAALMLSVVAVFLYHIFKPKKFVTFHVYQVTTRVKSWYEYRRGSRTVEGTLEEIALAVRRETDKIMLAKEHSDSFRIVLTDPSGLTHMSRGSRLQLLKWCRPLSDAEQQIFWEKFHATQVTIAVAA